MVHSSSIARVDAAQYRWVLVVGFVLSAAVAGLVYGWVARDQDRDAQTRFERLARSTLQQVSERMARYEYGLRGTRGAALVLGQEGIALDKFRLYSSTRDYKNEFPGARGYGYIEKVPQDQTAAYEARVRQVDGRSLFKVRQLSEHDGDRWVIRMIEPEVLNRQAVGLDIASEANRRGAMLKAVRSGQATLTHPITLVQAEGRQGSGFLMMMPIYRPGADLSTSESREQAAYGLSYTPLVIDEVLADVDTLGGTVGLVLADQHEDQPNQVFYRSSPDVLTQPGRQIALPLSLFGCEWVVTVKAMPPFEASLNHNPPEQVASLVAFVGGLLTVLAFGGLTSYRRRAQSLRSQARLAALVAASGDAVVTLETDGRVIDWNSAAQRLLGRSAEQVLGLPLHEHIQPTDASPSSPHVWWHPDSVADHAVRRFESNGETHQLALSSRALNHPDGEHWGYALVARDVTQDLANQAALAESEWRLKTMTRNLQDYAFFTLNQTGHINSWNEGSHALFSLNSDDALGLSLTQLVQRHPETSAGWQTFCRQVNAQSRVEHRDWLRRDASTQFFCVMSVVPLLDDDGAPKGFGVICHDTTLTQALQEYIQHQNEELEEKVEARTQQLVLSRQTAERLAQVKSDFLSNMSHEIRTPLNAILGLSYALSRMPLEQSAAALLAKVRNAGDTLLRIVNDVLDYSKIEAGSLTLDNQPFLLGDVIEGVAGLHRISAHQREVQLRFAPSPAFSRTVVGDALRLTQVLNNLVGNAIKFTPKGSVTVSVAVVGENQHRIGLRFDVTDTGIGIELETQARLFSPFVQADATTTRRFGGTGLGLAISRNLIELMGGRINLNSEEGKGSSFWFELWLDLASDTLQDGVDASNLTLLLTDADDTSRQELKAMVEAMGWRAQVFPDVRELLDHALSLPKGPVATHALLMPWALVQSTGLPMLREVTDQTHGGRPLALLVIEGGESLEDISVWADAVLMRPVDASSLFNGLMMARAKRRLPRLSSSDGSKRRLSGVRLLVVDDAELNRDVAQEIFGEEGAVLAFAEDGQKALDWLDAHPEDVDVVLMDVHMPVMDGLVATQAIRHQPRFAQLPVLALAAGVLKEQKDKAMAAGMNDFISKPFDVDKAVGLIRLYARQSSEDDASSSAEPLPPVAPVETAEPTPAVSPDDSAAPERQVINHRHGMTVFRKLQRYHDALRKFVAQYEPVLSLFDSSDPQHREEQTLLTHKVRGIAGMLGLERLADVATDYDNRHAVGEPFDELMPQVAQMLRLTLGAIAAELNPPPASTSPPAASPTVESPDPSIGSPQRDALVQALAALRQGLGSLDPDDLDTALGQLKSRLTVPDWPELQDALDQCDLPEAIRLVEMRLLNVE